MTMNLTAQDSETVGEVRRASDILAGKIEELVQEFEAKTGCFIHSIPVTQSTGASPVKVLVKVQITPPR